MFHPISLVLPKETGWSPKEKRFLGWWRPREVSGPTRLSHSRGSCHSAAKVSASRTYFITRPRGEGLGLDVDWRLKVFCPAFLQKSGRGPGAEPMAARRSARNAPCAHKAQEGVKGGTLAGGSPFAGGLSRPQPLRATVGPTVIRRRAGGGTPPLRGGWRNAVRPAVDVGKGRRGRRPLRVPAGRAVCRGIYCEIITRSGRGWRNGVTPAVTVTAGRRGRRPLRGGRGSLRWRVCLARYLFTASQRGGVPSPPERRFTTHPILK